MKKIKMNKNVKKFMPLIIIVVLIVIPAIIASTMGNSLMGASVVPQVEVTEVTTDNIMEELVITGTVTSEKTSILFSPVNGTVDSCTAVVGQPVEEGDVLVTFDLDELESAYLQSELTYLQSKSEYDITISSNNELISDAAAAKQEVTNLESSITTLEANIASYENKLSELVSAQTALESEIESLTAQITEQELIITELNSEALVEDVNTDATDTNGEDTSTQELIVQAGAKLEELQVQLEAAQASYATTTTSITSYTSKLEEASQELSEQSMSLAENEAIAESGENAMTTDQLAVLEMSNELAELASLDADELYEKGKEGIIAPYDGVISSVTILEGSQVVQGMELITIASNTDVCVEIEVSTDDFDNLQIGDEAEIVIKDTVYSGVVSEMNQIVTTNATGSSVIGAKIQITNPDENIFLGIEAKATIITAEKEDVICIPSSVINTSVDGDFVYVLEDGIVVERPIEIGLSVLDKVEITSGLEVGEQVISDMTTVLYEGMEAQAKVQ